MSKKESLHLLYIPGLSDKQTLGPQLRAVKTWRWWGVRAELFRINWYDNEPWESKLQRLLLRIDTLRANGHQVALVGASAGAMPAICAYAARPKMVIGVVTIAGKINRPEAIGDRYKKDNPALMPAAEACQSALQKLTDKQLSNIQSRRALYDEVVKKPDSYLPGAHNTIVPSAGHALTIAVQLLLGAPSFIKFLKSLKSAEIKY